MGPNTAGAALLKHIEDDELKDNAVWAAVCIFGEWRWEGAVEGLVDLLEKRTHLRGDISRALTAITGKDFGVEAADWRIGLNASEFYVDLKQLFGQSEISEYSIREEYINIIVKLEGARSQQVLLFREPNMKLYTECGVITEKDKERVEKMNETLEHAELLCEEVEDCFKVTLSAPVSENIDPGALKGQILEFAATADTWEMQLTGQDNI